MSGIYNDEVINELSAFFLTRNDAVNRLGNVIDTIKMFPGLRGLWPMSIFDSNGNAQDISGHGHHLSYNGNPSYNYDGLAPYIAMDGTGDFLSIADAADFDILGTESYVANPGLTMGLWVYVIGTSTYALMGKWKGVGDLRAYALEINSTPTSEFYFDISTDGTNGGTTFFNGSSPITYSAWHFIVARFTPSTEMKVWVDGVPEVYTTSIPASIFNSSEGFALGNYGSTGTSSLNGRISLPFLCASAVSDAMINAAFQQSRVLFGI